MSSQEKALIGKALEATAQNLKARLAQMDIEIALAHNAGGCGSGGCKPGEVEIWAHKDDVEEIQRLLEGQWRAHMESMGHDPDLANQVFDPEKETAICPACATEFSTKLNECPDCGLCFGEG